MREYLPSLIEPKNWTQAIHPLQVGDKVLVMDENNRRGDWVIGEVVKLLPSIDGVVRKAIVRAGRTELTAPKDGRSGNVGQADEDKSVGTMPCYLARQQ